MKHFTDSELADLIAGTLAGNRAAHADACTACRAHADALRAVLIDDVPEPSPLFWDHFAARVADAVRNDTPDAPAGPLPEWLNGPAITWALAASVAILLTVAGVWRTTLHAPPANRAAAATAVRGAAPVPDTYAPAATDDIDADRAWAVVRTAAEGLEWDDARAAGISLNPGAAEGLALELTAEERSELARLIAVEMKRRGA